MKRGELERKLKALGWFLERHGRSHDEWGHRVMTHKLYVPRHAIVRMGTARQILRDAQGEP